MKKSLITLFSIITILVIIFLGKFINNNSSNLGKCNQPSTEQFAKNNNLIAIKERGIYYPRFYERGNGIYKIITGEPCGIDLEKTIFNAKTFQILNGSYIKDNNKIYYNESLMKEVDSESFEVFNEHPDFTKNKNNESYIGQINSSYVPSFAKDKNNIFFLGKIVNIKNIDIETFHILPATPASASNNTFVKDKNNIYSFDFRGKFEVMTNDFNNPDIETFEPVLTKEGTMTEFFKDKNKAYFKGNVWKSKSISNPNNVYAREHKVGDGSIDELYELVNGEENCLANCFLNKKS